MKIAVPAHNTIWISPSDPAASTLPANSGSGLSAERTISTMRVSFSSNTCCIRYPLEKNVAKTSSSEKRYTTTKELPSLCTSETSPLADNRCSVTTMSLLSRRIRLRSTPVSRLLTMKDWNVPSAPKLSRP